jgi:hypothetical protein
MKRINKLHPCCVRLGNEQVTVFVTDNDEPVLKTPCDTKMPTAS